MSVFPSTSAVRKARFTKSRIRFPTNFHVMALH